METWSSTTTTKCDPQYLLGLHLTRGTNNSTYEIQRILSEIYTYRGNCGVSYQGPEEVGVRRTSSINKGILRRVRGVRTSMPVKTAPVPRNRMQNTEYRQQHERTTNRNVRVRTKYVEPSSLVRVILFEQTKYVQVAFGCFMQCVNWKPAHLDALGARVLAVALAFPLGCANKPPDAIERVHREERGRHTTSKSRNSSYDRGGAERAGRGTLITREGFFFFLGGSLVACCIPGIR